jgi:Icc-related predicted phosphoesterase
MPVCLFASDLHGRVDRYHKLFDAIRADQPAGVFLGGDLLPSALLAAAAGEGSHDEFVRGFIGEHLARLRRDLGRRYPAIFVILGNDDARTEEAAVAEVVAQGLWTFASAPGRVGRVQRVRLRVRPADAVHAQDWERA